MNAECLVKLKATPETIINITHSNAVFLCQSMVVDCVFVVHMYREETGFIFSILSDVADNFEAEFFKSTKAKHMINEKLRRILTCYNNFHATQAIN